MLDPTSFFTMERHVTDSDVDLVRRQKLSSMFMMFQDIAALHAANLGAAVDWLHEEMNVAWILMRVRVEIDHYPMLAQDVLVETWPQDPRPLYERDYVIRDTEGNILVRAASTWVIVDLGTRDIKRDKFLDYFGLEMNKDRALGKSLGRIKSVEKADHIYAKEVKFSDVDYNIHVNNAKYVDFIMDCFSFEEHRTRDINAIEVNYINEIGPGETFILRRKEIREGVEYIDGIRKSDRAYVFNALVEWGEKGDLQVLKNGEKRNGK